MVRGREREHQRIQLANGEGAEAVRVLLVRSG